METQTKNPRWNYPSKLAAKVAAQNEANETANSMYQKAVDAITPFLGKKICKDDGGLLEKVKAALPEVTGNQNEINGYYSTGHGYNLTINIRAYAASVSTRPGFGQHSFTGEAVLYIAEIRDGALTKICEPYIRRTDYTETEIQDARRVFEEARKVFEEARKVFEEARSALSNAQSNLHGFGEYD